MTEWYVTFFPFFIYERDTFVYVYSRDHCVQKAYSPLKTNRHWAFKFKALK